jgi:hypothetical protein
MNLLLSDTKSASPVHGLTASTSRSKPAALPVAGERKARKRKAAKVHNQLSKTRQAAAVLKGLCYRTANVEQHFIAEKNGLVSRVNRLSLALPHPFPKPS